MKKFENIKTGDIVYIKRRVSYGYNKSKSFYVPVEVIKVTNTQFVTQGNHRFKKEGNGIGDNRYNEAYLEGEEISWRNITIKDQTEEMRTFATKIKKENDFNDLVYGLRIPKNSTLSETELNEIYEAAQKIKSTIAKHYPKQ